MKIVSANYRDRRSKKPWLVRNASEHPRKAVAFKEVHIKGHTTFCTSERYEQGFGCSVVASCQEATGTNDSFPTQLSEVKTRIHFNVFRFVDEAGNDVPECKELLLRADGSMYAVL
jgi:hypothetical protein